MKHKYLRILPTVLVVYLGSGTPLAAFAGEDWNACTMLQKSEIESAFAPRKFDAGTLAKQAVKSSAKLADVTSCTYTSQGATARDILTVSLLARRAPDDASGVTPNTAKIGAAQLKATTITELPVLGEGAYWVNLGSAVFPMLQINVFKGKREWLVFGVSGRKLDQAAALTALTQVAKATVKR
jgi:hypothetical protein